MKPFKQLMIVLVSMPMMLISKAQVSQQYSVSGYIKDSATQQPLSGAKIELLFSGKSAGSTLSAKDGHFDIQISKLQAFGLRVSLKGYNSYSSGIIAVASYTHTYNIGEISLAKPRVIMISKVELVNQKLNALHYLPTDGAYTLFYALNPVLRNKTEVPADYKIIYPILPKFKPVKRTFRKRFKKDKKKEEPYIYTFSNVSNDENMTRIQHDSKLFANWNTDGLPADNLASRVFGVFNKNAGPFFSGITKKFVFVFFKLDPAGNPVFLNYRYRVYYFPENVRGNESLYNKTGDATYGYAPMKARIYNVEVYDQQQGNKRVNVSDDQVDPQVFFQRNDLFNSWIKIPIQVYE